LTRVIARARNCGDTTVDHDGVGSAMTVVRMVGGVTVAGGATDVCVNN
jgi:hypothetical protein